MGLPVDDYKREAEERAMQDGMRKKSIDLEQGQAYPPAQTMAVPTGTAPPDKLFTATM